MVAKDCIDRMVLDLDMEALAQVPDGYSEVLTFAEQYCTLDDHEEFPGVVTMRAHDDTWRVLYTICSRWDALGHRFDEPGYDKSQPYIHISIGRDGKGRYTRPVKQDKTARIRGGL